ncbi:MAG: helix-turn-helix domain-containing protein [Intestinibacter sp.]|uniref:helix-turn-helix domain-containing protein n=1 Tax=Intestinibacter sp. TaxID=1965304 RepID=UPI0025C62CC2|nr:helix-turn-helix transcriptional regulator [Intestinibacter sp.]MCI6738780.1 helix-turn-helix domain-containing protein [Intestinibacter sp.]
MIIIGEQLVKLRKENNMSQEKLAELLGVSRQTIYKWENNKVYPDMINLVAISEIFDVSIDELIKGEQRSNQTVNQVANKKTSYEYKSEKYIGNLPLIHINLGIKNCKARGIIAIGNVSIGLISIGLVSAGLFSLGALSLGFFAIGLLSLAIIASGFCGIGVISASVIAIGIYSLGVISIGLFSIGGLAFSKYLSVGYYAKGSVAIGVGAKGATTLVKDTFNELLNISKTDIHTLFLSKYRDFNEGLLWWFDIFF